MMMMITATSMAMACDDASATRTGPHAEIHTEALAAANFIAGPIVTGLEHGYKMGKTSTHASNPEGAELRPCAVLTPLPRLAADGEFTLEHTGGEYTLLGKLVNW